MDIHLRGYQIQPDGSLQIESVVTNDDDIVHVGDIVQVGVELPAIPGLRGHYLVAETELGWQVHEIATQTATLVRASRENLEAHAEQMIEGYTARDWGPAPDWAAVWDRLEFLPQHRRAEALRRIQQAHQDRVDRAARAERIAALAKAEADRRASQREDEAREIVRKADEIQAQRAFEKYKGPTQRKIDLDD